MTVAIAMNVAEAEALLADVPSPIVIIPVYGAYDDVVSCLESIMAHTGPGTGVLVVDDGGLDRRAPDLLQAIEPAVTQRLVVLRRDTNGGFVRACNDGFAASRGRDVVVLNSDVIVGPEWLERLTAAALSADNIATASTLTNHGTILSVPRRNEPVMSLLEGFTPDDASRRVAAASLRLRPTIPTAIGHCFYISRRALDLVGGFDIAFDPGYGEEVDFSQRALAHGFRHIVADDVFVFHRGSASFRSSHALDEQRARHDALVVERYPWYEQAVLRAATDLASPLADALGTARRALVGLTVGVDGLSLGPYQMGTQRIVIQSIRALAKRKEINRLVVFVPRVIPAYVEAVRDEFPAVDFIAVNPFVATPERIVDVIYRPCQVSELVDLDFLAHAGERFVVNQLDTIAFDNPAYFASNQAWVTYRDVTRLTLELAHGVAFLSEQSRRAVDAEGLLPAATPRAVVSCGINDPAGDEGVEPVRPRGMPEGHQPFLLCLGASYLHKNRRFTMELWAELRRRGWEGGLVLAGPTPPDGNSLAREAELLLRTPTMRHHVVTLGAVTEPEKAWLYGNASLVLYPSTIEGFGLVPFEAALHGAPTLATRQASLDEVLPPGIPVLADFDVVAGADHAWTLLQDSRSREDLVTALRIRAQSFTWDATAERLIDLFAAALARPAGRTMVLDGEGAHPVGLASRYRQRRVASASGAVERVVQAIITRPGLKQGLSPDGSRRQQVARTMISQVRRHRG